MESPAHSPGLQDLLAHDAWLRRLAAELVQDPGTADDIVQETWLAAIQAREVRSPKAWLGRVLGLRLRSHLRQRTVRHDAEVLAASRDLSAPGNGAPLEEELLRGLASAIQELSDPLRATLVEHYFHGVSSGAAAEATEVPQGTIRWRLMRGRAQLRESLERRFGGDTSQWMPGLALLARTAPARSIEVAAVSGAAGWATFAALALVGVLAVGGWTLWTSDATAMASVSVEDPRSPERAPAAGDARVASLRIDAPERERASSLPAEAVASLAPAAEEPAQVPSRSASNAADYSLTVMVTDAATRRPLAGALAYAMDPEGMRRIGQADAEGRIDVRLEASDFHGAGFEKLAGMASVRFVSEHHTWSSVHSFTQAFLSQSGPPRVLQLALEPDAGTLRGIVTDPAGEPLPGALVRVSRRSTPQFTPQPGFTTTYAPIQVAADDAGRFEVHGLPPVPMNLRARKPGYLDGVMDLDIEPALTRELNLILKPGGICRGLVSDEHGHPVPGARIWHDPVRGGLPTQHQGDPGFVPELLGFSSSVRSDERGEFELDDLRPGAVRLWVEHPSDPSWLQHAERTVDADAPLLWNPILQRGEALEFQVIDHRGQPLRAGGIRLLSASSVALPWRRNRELSIDGTLTLYDWVDVPFEVTVNDSVWMATAPLYFARDLRAADSPFVIQLTDRTPARVSGRVLDSSGEPPVEAFVSFGNFELEFLACERIGSADGTFALDLPPGRYQRAIHVEGQGIARQDDVVLHAGESLEWNPAVPPTVPLRVVPRSGAPGGDSFYRLQAVLNWRTELQAVIVIRQGGGFPTETLQVLPGPFVYLFGRNDEIVSRTLIPVQPVTGGDFDPDGDAPALVPILVLRAGDVVPPGTTLAIETLSTPGAAPPELLAADERTPQGRWLAHLSEGSYRATVRFPDGRSSEHLFALEERGTREILVLECD